MESVSVMGKSLMTMPYDVFKKLTGGTIGEVVWNETKKKLKKMAKGKAKEYIENKLAEWFKENYPQTTVLVKRKGGGGFEAEDPQLWAEIEEKGDAVIIGMGH